MTAQKMDSAIRQEQIAQAALRLIGELGLRQLSVVRLARQVGLTPSAIYRHYASKEDIIDAILEQLRHKLLGNVDAVCQETPDALERLRRLLTRHIALIQENHCLPRIIFSEDIYQNHPERKRRVYENLSAYLGQVGEIVRQGQQAGRLCSDMEPSVVAVLFLGLIQPAALLWQLSDGDFDVNRHTEQAWRIFRTAIAHPDADSAHPDASATG